MKKDHLLSIGVMTGNSLDAADVVLTAFHNSGKIIDLEFHSLPYPEWLFYALKHLRDFINCNDNHMKWAALNYCYTNSDGHQLSFDDLLEAYMQFVAQAVGELISKAENDANISAIYDIKSIDLIGFHGQTCAHMPPSISSKPDEVVYTLQIGNGQRLADLTGITTVYDFRSDDIMHGGEGAPFAPMHNRHIAQELESLECFPITFINGGNTSNIAHITYNESGEITVVGWDAGPFNHLPDALVRSVRKLSCDMDGHIGSQGQVNIELLRKLFNKAAINQQGDNFLLLSGPKSSDPQWYNVIPELLDSAILFEDRLRTAEYFSAYALYYSLGHTNKALQMPSNFAVFGGGWKNPVVLNHFCDLIHGNFTSSPILDEHRDWFGSINSRLHKKSAPIVQWSDKYGFNGRAMEARIFADMACCKIRGIPFTNKAITNASSPVVCGVIKYPQNSKSNATANLLTWMPDDLSSAAMNEGIINKGIGEERWSRAAKYWKTQGMFVAYSPLNKLESTQDEINQSHKTAALS